MANWACLAVAQMQARLPGRSVALPQLRGTMKIIAFIEAHPPDIIRKVFEHCGLRHYPPPRAPPRALPPSQTVRSGTPPASEPGITHEVEPDFLEHLRRDSVDRPNCPGSRESRRSNLDFGLGQAGIRRYAALMLPVDGPRAPAGSARWAKSASQIRASLAPYGGGCKVEELRSSLAVESKDVIHTVPRYTS